MSNSIDQDRIDGGVYFSDPIHIGDEPKFEFDSIGTDRFGDQQPYSLEDIQSPSLAKRSKRRPGTMGPGEKTFRNIVLEELQNFHTSNEDDFKRKNKELSQSIDNEVAEFRKTLNSVPNTYNQDRYVQEYEFLQHKAAAAREEYTSKTPTAYAFYGESPLYLSKELPFRRVTELTQDKALNTLEQMQKVWTDWDNTTKAAQDLKLATRSIEVLSKKLQSAADAFNVHSTEVSSNSSLDNQAISHKIAAIDSETSLAKWLLPDFLHQQIENSTFADNLTQNEKLNNLKEISNKLRQKYEFNVGSFSIANPNITSPLLKPELEALKRLVEAQAANKLGQRWADYHKSLLNSESASHLEAFAADMASFEARAIAAAQEQQRFNERRETSFQNALSRLAKEQASRRTELDSNYAANLSNQSTVSLTNANTLNSSHPTADILDAKTKIILQAMQTSELLKSKIASAHSFSGGDPLEITNDQYTDLLRARSNSAEQAQKIHSDWERSYSDGLEARLLAHALTELENRSNQLSESYAEAAWKSSHSDEAHDDLDTKTNNAANSSRLWNAVQGTALPSYELPNIGDLAAEISKQLFSRKAIEVIGNRLPLVLALYPSELGNSELPAKVLATPAKNIGAIPNSHRETVNGNEVVTVTHRLMPVPGSEDGRLEWKKADGVSIGSQVRIRPAVFDPNTNTYNFTRDGESTPSLTWTPQHLPGDSSTALPGASPDTSPYVGAETPPASFDFYSNPEHLLEPDDYIVELPAELGLENPYIYFKNPRNIPGVASGSGQAISGTWLGEQTRGEGAPVPAQIANQLRGQRFKNFDRFREAFWESVAADAQLGSQLSSANLSQAKRGKAPYPQKNDQVGGRDKFEIHHVAEVAKGGAVYDMDNMVIMTPAQHIEYHKGE